MSAPSPNRDPKVIDAGQLAQALVREDRDARALADKLIAPTAEDLLALTVAAIEDVQGAVPLSDAQRAALANALRRKLVDAVMPRTDRLDDGP